MRFDANYQLIGFLEELPDAVALAKLFDFLELGDRADRFSSLPFLWLDIHLLMSLSYVTVFVYVHLVSSLSVEHTHLHAGAESGTGTTSCWVL